MIESGTVLRKSTSGETMNCSIVAFVEIKAFGTDRGVLAVVVKSFVPGDLFCEEVQPGGRSGGEIESKFSENGNLVLPTEGGM